MIARNVDIPGFSVVSYGFVKPPFALRVGTVRALMHVTVDPVRRTEKKKIARIVIH